MNKEKNIKIKLHHFAYNIKPNTLELVIELLEQLACTVSYREKNARWCMMEQKPILIDVQFIETQYKSIPTKNKINTHIAFLTNDPQKYIKQIKKWAINKNLKFTQGKWSDKELWFDLPDLFVNFVIEIMHTSVVK